jgi:hypothetical protein
VEPEPQKADEPRAEPRDPLLDKLDTPAAMREHVETEFAAERVDPSWAPAAETSLTTAFTKALPEGSRLMRADCHETICRVRLEHTQALAHAGLARALPPARPWNAPMFISPPILREDGKVESQIHIAREGHPLEGIAE